MGLPGPAAGDQLQEMRASPSAPLPPDSQWRGRSLQTGVYLQLLSLPLLLFLFVQDVVMVASDHLSREALTAPLRLQLLSDPVLPLQRLSSWLPALLTCLQSTHLPHRLDRLLHRTRPLLHRFHPLRQLLLLPFTPCWLLALIQPRL